MAQPERPPAGSSPIRVWLSAHALVLVTVVLLIGVVVAAGISWSVLHQPALRPVPISSMSVG